MPLPAEAYPSAFLSWTRCAAAAQEWKLMLSWLKRSVARNSRLPAAKAGHRPPVLRLRLHDRRMPYVGGRVTEWLYLRYNSRVPSNPAPRLGHLAAARY